MRRLFVFLAFLAVAVLSAPVLAAGPGSVPRITPGELKARLDRHEEIVVLDVRTAASYASSSVKIKGALRIPPQELGARAGELPFGKEIVTYCT